MTDHNDGDAFDGDVQNNGDAHNDADVHSNDDAQGGGNMHNADVQSDGAYDSDAHDDAAQDDVTHDDTAHDNAARDGAVSAGVSDDAQAAGVREGIVFTNEQQEALAELTRENTYAKQSKWRTFRELPLRDKWPFFVQNFLVGTLFVVVAVVLIVAFVYEYVTKGPDPQLYIVGVNMTSDISEQMEDMEEDFAEQSGLDTELMEYDGDYQITETGTIGGTVDSSAKLLASVSAGTVNTIITDQDTFEELCERGLVSSLDDVLEADQVEELDESDAIIDVTVEDEDGDVTLSGIDLTHSEVWEALGDDVPDDLVLAFSNTEETGVEYPQAFVDYLDFS